MNVTVQTEQVVRIVLAFYFAEALIGWSVVAYGFVTIEVDVVVVATHERLELVIPFTRQGNSGLVVSGVHPTTTNAKHSLRVAMRKRGVGFANTFVWQFAGPDSNDTVLFKLHEGTTIQSVRIEDDWSLIRLSDSKRGWVESSTIEQIIEK